MKIFAIILSSVSLLFSIWNLICVYKREKRRKQQEELRHKREQVETEERIKHLKENAEKHVKNCLMLSQEIDQLLEEDTDKSGSDYSESGDHDTYYS